MKKLTLSALIASTLFITACEQAQDATEGTMDKASEMTNSAAEHAGHAAEAGKDMASDAMEAGKGMVDKAADMAKDTMEGFTGAGFHTGTKGHPVGTQADIDALSAEYHEQMKAHQ